MVGSKPLRPVAENVEAFTFGGRLQWRNEKGCCELFLDQRAEAAHHAASLDKFEFVFGKSIQLQHLAQDKRISCCQRVDTYFLPLDRLVTGNIGSRDKTQETVIDAHEGKDVGLALGLDRALPFRIGDDIVHRGHGDVELAVDQALHLELRIRRRRHLHRNAPFIEESFVLGDEDRPVEAAREDDDFQCLISLLGEGGNGQGTHGHFRGQRESFQNFHGLLLGLSLIMAPTLLNNARRHRRGVRRCAERSSCWGRWARLRPFFEFGSDRVTDYATPNFSRGERLWCNPGLRPLSQLQDSVSSPIGAYRWEYTDRALTEQLLLEDEGQPATVGQGHAAIRYVNPTTSGDVMPTIRCEFHRLRDGTETPSRQDVGSSVFQVFSGKGVVVLGGKTYQLQKGDMFVVPSWIPFSLQAETQFDLFAFSDAPIMERLHFSRTRMKGQD